MVHGDMMVWYDMEGGYTIVYTVRTFLSMLDIVSHHQQQNTSYDDADDDNEWLMHAIRNHQSINNIMQCHDDKNEGA